MTLEEKIKFFIDRDFTYDENTGDVKGPSGKILTAKRGGYICMTGYPGKVTIYAHQFGYYCKYNVVGMIDHIDRDRSNNKIDNLHIVSHQENNNNKFGKGYEKKGNKFQSRIVVNRKRIHLGMFCTEQQARQAYLDAKKIYHNV